MIRFARAGLVTRLVALTVALLIVSCLAVGIVTTIGMRTFLTHRLDQDLTAAGMRYALSLEHPGSDADGDNDNQAFSSTVGQAAGTLGARILNNQVTAIGVVDSGDDHPAPSAADEAALLKLSVSSKPFTARLPHLGEYRLSVQSGQDGDVLITGLPMTSVDEPVHNLLLTEGIVFSLAVVVAAIIGLLSIRRALGPLNRIATTARGVSDLPLSSGSVVLPEQVPNPRPGTEVGVVTDAFNRMLDHVQEALETRHADEEKLRHFIADASHELRTPVAVIASHAEYAQREHSDPEAVEESLRRIRSESARMASLVDDLLLLARLDDGRTLAQEPVDLTRVVLDAVADISRIAPSHSWRMDLPEEPVTTIGDEHALHQALANLLTNARTHTPPGTEVLITLSRAPTGVVLRVQDNGPGIPSALMPSVLDRFSRAEVSRGRTDGAGLGLAITDAIIRAHEGRLEVESHPGSTTFTVTLPR